MVFRRLNANRTFRPMLARGEMFTDMDGPVEIKRRSPKSGFDASCLPAMFHDGGFECPALWLSTRLEPSIAGRFPVESP